MLNPERTETDVRELFGKVGKVTAETQWFLYAFGGLNVLQQISETETVRAAIELMRKDISDFTTASAVLADKMDEVLDNIEKDLEEKE